MYLLTDARVCSLRPCYVARVSATLPLVEEGKLTPCYHTLKGASSLPTAASRQIPLPTNGSRHAQDSKRNPAPRPHPSLDAAPPADLQPPGCSLLPHPLLLFPARRRPLPVGVASMHPWNHDYYEVRRILRYQRGQDTPYTRLYTRSPTHTPHTPLQYTPPPVHGQAARSVPPTHQTGPPLCAPPVWS